jgi:hypothetical protein
MPVRFPPPYVGGYGRGSWRGATVQVADSIASLQRKIFALFLKDFPGLRIDTPHEDAKRTSSRVERL